VGTRLGAYRLLREVESHAVDIEQVRRSVYQRVWEGVHEGTGERAWLSHHAHWEQPIYPSEEMLGCWGGGQGVGSLLGLRGFESDGEGGWVSVFGWVDAEGLEERWGREGAAPSAARATEALARVAHAADGLGGEGWRVLPCDVWLERGEGRGAWLMPLAQLRAGVERERRYSGSDTPPPPPDLQGLSPECINGASSGAGARVYALSSVLQRWLSGEDLVNLPPSSSFVVTLMEILEGRLRPVKTLEPRALAAMQRLLRRGLAAQPKLRHADPGAWMEEALRWAVVEPSLGARSVSEALVWARERVYEGQGDSEEVLGLIASRAPAVEDEPLWAYLWDHSGAKGLEAMLELGAPTRWGWGVGGRLPQAREVLWGAARDPRSSESALVLAARLLSRRQAAGLDSGDGGAWRAWLDAARQGARPWLARVAASLWERHFDPAEPRPMELPVPALAVPAPPQPPVLEVPRFGQG
jgi:hypothetical protein